MKIAYLAQSYPPMISGAAIVAAGLANAMASRNHQVLVIAASDTDRTYRVQEGNLSVLRLQSLHNPLRVGQRCLLYPRRAVLQALEEFRPQAIHAHDPLQISWLGLDHAIRANIPIALTIHQIPSGATSYLPKFLRRPAEMMLWMYARWILRRFTSIITPTQVVSTMLHDGTGLHGNTIGYGVDLRLFRPLRPAEDVAALRQKWHLPVHAPLLLHVGRLDVDKHVERVVQAAALVMKETESHLLLVGDGTEKQALRNLCDSLGISERVHFSGYVSAPESLAELYRLANLFILASEVETQGIVLLEAAASGLPLVAVRATCIPEIVHDGINGYLAQPGDLRGLANAMSLLLSDPRKSARMGNVSRAVAEEYKIELTVDMHEQLYRQMIMDGRLRSLGTGWHGSRQRVKAWKLF